MWNKLKSCKTTKNDVKNSLDLDSPQNNPITVYCAELWHSKTFTKIHRQLSE